MSGKLLTNLYRSIEFETVTVVYVTSHSHISGQTETLVFEGSVSKKLVGSAFSNAELHLTCVWCWKEKCNVYIKFSNEGNP